MAIDTAVWRGRLRRTETAVTFLSYGSEDAAVVIRCSEVQGNSQDNRSVIRRLRACGVGRRIDQCRIRPTSILCDNPVRRSTARPTPRSQSSSSRFERTCEARVRAGFSARKDVVAVAELPTRNTCGQRLAGGLSDLELHRPLRLPLHDDGTTSDGASQEDAPHP